jgi:hypothetical protein
MKKAVLTIVFLSMLLMLTLTAIPVHAAGNPDVNGDGKVDIVDIALILRAFGTTHTTGGNPGDWGAWNPACDISGPTPGVSDGIVDIYDIIYAEHYFGTGVTSLTPQPSNPNIIVRPLPLAGPPIHSRDLTIRIPAGNPPVGLSAFQFIITFGTAPDPGSFSAIESPTGLMSMGTTVFRFAQLTPNIFLVGCALLNQLPLTLNAGPAVTLATINFVHSGGPTIITMTSNLYNINNPYNLPAAAIPHIEFFFGLSIIPSS